MEKKVEYKKRFEGKNNENDSKEYDYDDNKESESKNNEREDKEEKEDIEDIDDGKNEIEFDIPQIDIISIIIKPENKTLINNELELNIIFTLDRDVVAGYWEFKVSSNFFCFFSFIYLKNLFFIFY